MSDFFSVKIDFDAVAAQTVRYGAREMVGRIGEGIRFGMERANLSILGRTMKGRFTGQGPFAVSANRLGVKTGQLRRSLRATKPVIVDLATLSVASKVGSKVKYFGAHEFGFRGTASVRSHVRRTRGGGRATVRAHSRKMSIPERRPLRTGFSEPAAQAVYQREITKAVAAAVQKP